jgi:uncharacterized protein with HEPN domain
MPRDSSVYLDDISTAIHRVQTYVAGMSREQFDDDEKTIDAVVRNLEIIGEAVKHLPQTLRDYQPQIPWQRIAGLRDILAHQYFAIDREIVWNIIQEKLGDLAQAVSLIQSRPTE